MNSLKVTSGILSETQGFHISNGWSPDKEGSHYFILSANHLTTKEKPALDAGWNRRVWTRQLLVGSMRESSAAVSDLWGNGCTSDSPHCRSWALEGAMNEDLQTPRWAGPDWDCCSKWRNDAEKSRCLFHTWVRTSPVLLSSLPSLSIAFPCIFRIPSLAITDAEFKAAATDSLLGNFSPCSSHIKPLWQWFLTESTKNGAPCLSSLQLTVTYLVAGLGRKHKISVCCHNYMIYFLNTKGYNIYKAVKDYL